MTENINRQVLLARRPQGAPRLDDFRMIDGPVPTPGKGELLLRNLYLSLDPYMRGRMTGRLDSYAPPYAVDAPPGGGTVARVIASHRDGFVEGDLVVVPDGGWRTYVVSDGTGLRRLPADMEVRNRRAAFVALLAFIDVPIVYFSVEWWRSLHQTATLSLNTTISGTMLFTLCVSIAVFITCFGWLLVHRFRVAWLEDEAEMSGLAAAIDERRAEAYA